MPFQFTDPASSPYRQGMLFLGRDPQTGQDVGISTERHCITIAGAGSGKGAALLIPNLLRWPHSALVIDPKGENAEHTWQTREAMGQRVHVLDPFKVANVPARLRGAFNPLAAIRAADLTIREDIRVIADGLVMRHNTRDAMWDNGSVSVLAGMIAHAITDAPEPPTLPLVRRLLRLSDDALGTVFNDMMASDALGGLAQAAAGVGLSSAKSAQEFIKGARDNTEWLDSTPIADILSHSTFDLADLKNGKTTVFLVLPPQYLGEHGRFLRLFVRCALNDMAKGGNRTGGKCLFLLDEFFSLGHISEIAKAAGLMRSYGVQLWPFLQDIGQLFTLYEREGAETFFGNADAHIYFGNTDPMTLGHISKGLGNLTPDEITTDIPRPPLSLPGSGAFTQWINQADRLTYEHQQNQYGHAMRQAGTPRLTSDEVASLVGNGPDDKVARSMIVFASGGRKFNLRLAPYFLPAPIQPPVAVSSLAPPPPFLADLLSNVVLPSIIIFPVVWIAWRIFCGLFRTVYNIGTHLTWDSEATTLATVASTGWAVWNGLQVIERQFARWRRSG